MKHECPTYLKSIGKGKALPATLSDTKPEEDSNNKDNGILNAFTATVNPTDGICREILKYSQVYEPYWSIVGQERGRTHRDLNERRKIKSNLNQINPNLV